jgi:probable FeS assembly SUF system protein SufT
MKSEKPVTLMRDCPAVMVPSGEKVILSAGSSVWITQSLGGSYTVMTDRGYMARIEGRDGDALGKTPLAEVETKTSAAPSSVEEVEEQIWNQLRSCYDPEIPVNIVELGLIYHCGVVPSAAGGYRATVRFTLTAQGCGMGQFLREEIRHKLLGVAGIREVEVELVWEPPWNQSMISDAAKQELGIA